MIVSAPAHCATAGLVVPMILSFASLSPDRAQAAGVIPGAGGGSVSTEAERAR